MGTVGYCLRSNDYFMVYRIDGNLVIIDVIYHELQDYESVFAQSMSLE